MLFYYYLPWDKHMFLSMYTYVVKSSFFIFSFEDLFLLLSYTVGENCKKTYIVKYKIRYKNYHFRFQLSGLRIKNISEHLLLLLI